MSRRGKYRLDNCKGLKGNPKGQKPERTSMSDRKAYCVVYRTGGTSNFKWNRSIAFETKEEAQETCNNVRLQGYKAFVEDYQKSLAIGLPETFE